MWYRRRPATDQSPFTPTVSLLVNRVLSRPRQNNRRATSLRCPPCLLFARRLPTRWAHNHHRHLFNRLHLLHQTETGYQHHRLCMLTRNVFQIYPVRRRSRKAQVTCQTPLRASSWTRRWHMSTVRLQLLERSATETHGNLLDLAQLLPGRFHPCPRPSTTRARHVRCALRDRPVP